MASSFWPRVRERAALLYTWCTQRRLFPRNVCSLGTHKSGSVINFCVVMHGRHESVVYRAPLFSNRICRRAIKMRMSAYGFGSRWNRIECQIRTGGAHGFGFPAPTAIAIRETLVLSLIGFLRKVKRRGENNICDSQAKSAKTQISLHPISKSMNAKLNEMEYWISCSMHPLQCK
jgi:hypothetical protein